MIGDSKITANHDEIRKWIEERGGKPAIVASTARNGRGILRIDFPGYRGKNSLIKISWNEFFQTFDKKNFLFLYQETTLSGAQSRFYKFIEKI